MSKTTIYCPECGELEADRNRLRGALKPFVAAWEKRSGPNQPSISSEMLVAVHVKHFINAKKILTARTERSHEQDDHLLP